MISRFNHSPRTRTSAGRASCGFAVSSRVAPLSPNLGDILGASSPIG